MGYFLFKSSVNDDSSSSVSFQMKSKSSLYHEHVIALSLMYGYICVDSNFPINMFAHDGVQIVSTVQSFI